MTNEWRNNEMTLERAAQVLEQDGHHGCAEIVRKAQEAIDAASEYLHDDPNDERDSELNKVCALLRSVVS
jgi:hypothetical protein